MAEFHDVLGVVAAVPISPVADRVQHREELLTRLRQLVLVTRGTLYVPRANENASRLERLQARGKNVARRAGVVDDVVESALAQGDLAQRKQRPLLADDLHGGLDRADARVGDPGSAHTSRVPWLEWICNNDPP